MRHLPVRPLVTGAVCAALAFGVAAPVAAADNGPSRDGARQAPAATPDAATLRGQVAQLRYAGEVLAPVSRLLDAVLQADNHQISRAEARRHTTAVHSAIALAQAQVAPAAPGTATGAAAAGAPQQATTLPDYQVAPSSANASAREDQTAAEQQAAPQGRQQGHHPHQREHARQNQHADRQQSAREATLPSATGATPELRARALTRLQAAVDTLVERSTAGNKAAVDRQIQVVVRAAVDYVATSLPAPGRHGTHSAATRPAAENAAPQSAHAHR